MAENYGQNFLEGFRFGFAATKQILEERADQKVTKQLQQEMEKELEGLKAPTAIAQAEWQELQDRLDDGEEGVTEEAVDIAGNKVRREARRAMDNTTDTLMKYTVKGANSPGFTEAMKGIMATHQQKMKGMYQQFDLEAQREEQAAVDARVERRGELSMEQIERRGELAIDQIEARRGGKGGGKAPKSADQMRADAFEESANRYAAQEPAPTDEDATAAGFRNLTEYKDAEIRKGMDRVGALLFGDRYAAVTGGSSRQQKGDDATEQRALDPVEVRFDSIKEEIGAIDKEITDAKVAAEKVRPAQAGGFGGEYVRQQEGKSGVGDQKAEAYKSAHEYIEMLKDRRAKRMKELKELSTDRDLAHAEGMVQRGREQLGF